MEMRLKDVMCRSFRFLIREEFRHELFDKAIRKEGTIKKLAKKIGCGRDSIRGMKIGETKFIKWEIVKKLIEIIKISKEEVEEHVLAIKSGMSGKVTEVKFPIQESAELALLIAKSMGDGSIEKDKFRFSFWNKEERLIEEVCICVNKAIGRTKGTINKLKDGRIQVKFCPFIGFALHFFGAPRGDKTLQTFDVPNWIKNGPTELRASFLRGLFDDEACVVNSGRKREIVISLCKDTEKCNSLKNFLNSVKKILLEFNINSSIIREQMRFRDRKNREKIMLQFFIRGKKNLENFMKRIGFTHPTKNLKLKKAVKSFVDIHKTKRMILKIILRSSKPLTTTEIARMVGTSNNAVLFHLNELSKVGKIFKNKASIPNIWSKR